MAPKFRVHFAPPRSARVLSSPSAGPRRAGERDARPAQSALPGDGLHHGLGFIGL